MKIKIAFPTFVCAVMMVFTSCAQKSTTISKNNKVTMSENAKLDTITLGGGCFWCVEAIYQRLNGVVSVTSGYAGGKVKNPSYREVCTGTTGHAESVQIVFDQNLVSLAEIFQVFFKVHDPTTLNRQGNDEGTQYRSVIFYANDAQKEVALAYIDQLNNAHAFRHRIVTQVVSLTRFYAAEDYHQNYLELHPDNPYIVFNDLPKLRALKKEFPGLYKQ